MVLQGVCAVASSVTGYLQGAADTKEYRQFVQHEGKDISAWHDVPLQNEDGSFNFVCEIPKETAAKMEVATVSAHSFPKTAGVWVYMLLLQ